MLKSAQLPKPLSFEDYEYEVQTLDNGLRLLLVSSDKIDKAACCIGVNIGSLHDPLQYQGLAHFCEHMLFMGNAKYPDETEYNCFIQKNGGSSNAFTSENETVYYGTVQPSALEGLVDRTVEFFVSPSFNESAVDREVEAVHSEFEKGLQEDGRRKNQVWKSLANDKSSFAKFNVGNNAHLRRLDLFNNEQDASLTALRNELIRFHSEHYSANQMSAVVMGKQRLDELREMAVPKLIKIQDKQIQMPRGAQVGIPNPPFRPEDLKKAIYIVPVQEMDRTVSFKFVIDDQFDLWREKPTNFISHVLGHEGSGSLLSVLKRQGLATGLSAGVKSQNVGQSFFVLAMEATERGLTAQGIQEAGFLVFMAIRQLIESGVTLEAVEEEVRIEEMRWRFQPMAEVHEFAIQGVVSLLNFPPELVFKGPYLPVEISLTTITATLKQMLSINHLNVVITGKCFAKDCDQVEPIYSTKYSAGILPAEWLEKWASVEKMDASDFASMLTKQGLALPQPNVYIAERLDLKGGADCIDDEPTPLPLNQPRVQVFHKKETSYKLPELIFGAEIYLPSLTPTQEEALADLQTFDYNGKDQFRDLPWNARLALISIYQRAITESLNEDTYDAQVAGLSFTLSLYRGTSKGAPSFSILLEGFDDKADVLLKTVLESMKSFKVTSEHIQLAITVLERTCANRLISTLPYQLVQLRASQILCPTIWDDKDLLECFRNISPQFVESMLKDSSGKLKVDQLFKGSAMQGLICGNVTQGEATENLMNPKLWEGIIWSDTQDERRLPNGQIDLSCLTKSRLMADTTNFTKGNTSDDKNLTALVMQGETLNRDDPNGAVQLLLQANGNDVSDVAFQNILTVWLSDKFFDDLRTRQTLGYVVGMTLQEQANRLMRGFLVQSTKDADVVINAILTFIKEWCFNEEGKVCPKLKAEELQEFCDAVIAQLREKPKKLLELHNRLYGEIKTARYDFNRRQKQIEYIQTYDLTKLTTDLTKLLTSRPWLIVSLQPTKKVTAEDINKDSLLPLSTFFLKDRKAIIRSALECSGDAAFIPMKRWGAC